MGEYWFDKYYIDVQHGELIADRPAMDRLQAGDPTIRHIGELVLADEFPFTVENFSGENVDARRVEIRTWSRAQCFRYGKWVGRLVGAETGEPSPVTRALIRRINVLGLGPHDTSLMRRSGVANLAEFRLRSGMPLGATKNRYAHWSVEDYAAYAQDLATSLGGRPSIENYDTAGATGCGPSSKMIRNGPVGGIEKLNDLIWFPDVESMNAEDIVFWGSRVRQANNGMRLTVTVLTVLSKRKRGPSTRSIYENFGDWQEFARQVNDQYESGQAEDDRLHKYKLELYAQMINTGKLPLDFAQLSEEDLLEAAGRYRIVDACAPDLSAHRKHKIARLPSSRLITSIIKARPAHTAGYVEMMADYLGVFDDVWPLEDGLQYLLVSEEELDEFRRRGATKQRQRRPTERAS